MGDGEDEPIIVECGEGEEPNMFGECELIDCPEGYTRDSNGECVEEEDCDTSSEDILELFPNLDIEVSQEIANIINLYGQDFGINTKEKLKHFLSQAGHESLNFNDFEENLNYRVNKLGIDYWQSRFNPYTSYLNPPTTYLDPNKENPNDYSSSISTIFVDHESFANYVYNDANRGSNYKLGNINDGDGYKYRGRGVFQLTGRNNFVNFNSFYQENYNSDINLIESPDLLNNDLELAIISALWFYEINVLNSINLDEETSVEDVTKKINGGLKGLNDRKNIYENSNEFIDCI
ncbi:hypothetical protein [Psychroflexus sp. MES1-P1E]|uniref:hypothetical protein n=1 Tax=Psychroflexus sp. MES1-P1E TaxID=2058320 RepID=UPI000C7E507A|nr:hypothetical protein [Psychroflexus sp. MES1-P1E]PKG41595.1 hypothetical protein CXF67_14765 [Psychroflexus sp. MES1-P1E]